MHTPSPGVPGDDDERDGLHCRGTEPMSAAIRPGSDPAEVRTGFTQPLPLPGPAIAVSPFALPPYDPQPAPPSPYPANDGIAPERRAAIESWVRDNAQPSLPANLFHAGHDLMADALAGISDLHQLSPPEQRMPLSRSLDVWQSSGDAEEVGRFADKLAGGTLSQLSAHSYAERAAGVAQGTMDHDVAPDTRVLASTLAAGAMVAAGPRDIHATRTLVEGLSPIAASGFADALDGSATAAGSSMSDPDDQDRLAAVLAALNAGPDTVTGRSFVTHAFASAMHWTYRDISVGEFGAQRAPRGNDDLPAGWPPLGRPVRAGAGCGRPRALRRGRSQRRYVVPGHPHGGHPANHAGNMALLRQDRRDHGQEQRPVGT